MTTADDERRAATRALWARGDYTPFGDLFAPVGTALCARVGVADLDVLDVGTGTGGTALAAARAGGRVSGIDLTPELLAVARRRGQAERLAVKWREGDAMSLPYPTASFDRVLSTFAVIFAPNPVDAASELVRVCRPDGVVAVSGWAADGVFWRMGDAMSALMPTQPEGHKPLEWGDPTAVRGFFTDLSVELTFGYEAVELSFASVDEAVDMFEHKSGPFLSARDTLDPIGRWPAARAAVAQVLVDANVATDSSLRVPADYLLTLATLDEGGS